MGKLVRILKIGQNGKEHKVANKLQTTIQGYLTDTNISKRYIRPDSRYINAVVSCVESNHKGNKAEYKNTSSRLLESLRRQPVTDEDVHYILRYTTIYLE